MPPTPPLGEPAATAVLLAIFGALIAASVVLNRAADRLGIPMVLIFLVLGMLGGSEGVGHIHFDNYEFAMRLGIMALVLILFDGGLNTSIAAVRQAIYPATLLATVGVVTTAGLVALCARFMGLATSQALLLGAVVSSTDAAAVFAVLRGGRIQLRPRLANTLEVESCVNDPMAIILTTSLIQLYTATQPVGWTILLAVPLQLAIGTGLGILLGYLGRWILSQTHPTSVGLYPALTLAIAFLSYGLADMCHGSGFIAVYATAVVLGNAKLPYRSGLTRIHDALAWLSQIAMFLMLGLLVYPSRLLPVAGAGLVVALFLAFIARPLSVFTCLLPFGFASREIAYVGWIGLRGAVPIILAIFPVLAGVPGADRIFDIVFFIVVVNALVPGTTIRPVTHWLGLARREKPTPAAVLEINSAKILEGELIPFFIEPSLAVCGAMLSEIEFPAKSAVVLVVRNDQLMAAKGDTTLQPGDHAYVFCQSQDRPLIDLLFGNPESES